MICFKTATLAAQSFQFVQLEADNAFVAFFPLFTFTKKKKYLFSYWTSLWELKESKICILKTVRSL